MRVITRYMKIPKIWRICVQQLKKDYCYTSLSMDYLKLRKLCCDSLNNYKIVQIKNYHSTFYRNRTKVIIFKKIFQGMRIKECFGPNVNVRV